MPITQTEKEQLQKILNKADAEELVRIAGSIYDCVLKANLETDKLLAIGKLLWARVKWSDMPVGVNDARFKILRSAEENFLQQLPNFFAVSETPPPQAEEPQATAPAANDEARLPDTTGESQVNEVVQIAKGTDGEAPSNEEQEPTEVAFTEVVPVSTGSTTIVTETTAIGPDVVAQGPDVVAQGQDVEAKGPEIVAQGPEIVAQGPEVVAQGPDVVETNGTSNGHSEQQTTETAPRPQDGTVIAQPQSEPAPTT